MSVTSGTPTLPADTAQRVWHTMPVEEVLQVQGVDPGPGLSSGEAASRAQRFGPNRFGAARVEPRWRAFARQYADPMQIVLLVAGAVSLYPLKELETGVVLIALTRSAAVVLTATSMWVDIVVSLFVRKFRH